MGSRSWWGPLGPLSGAWAIRTPNWLPSLRIAVGVTAIWLLLDGAPAPTPGTAEASSAHRTLIPAIAIDPSGRAGPVEQPVPPTTVASSGPPTPVPPTPIPPTPVPNPVPVQLPQSAPACATSLQSLVDQAPAGSTVRVPACLYREMVTVAKPLTLAADPGAEIRGSDVWADGWVGEGAYWVRGSVPSFRSGWSCETGTDRCNWPEQVFLDGRPLEQVAASPGRGQFAVDGARRVVLADDPRGRTVEVTVRERWVRTRSEGVTIQGFRMRHAASPAQDGGLSNRGYDRWTAQDNVLSDAHGAVVSIRDATGIRLLRNEIFRGGQEGVHGTALSDTIVRGNRIHGNNTERFNAQWEASGLKITVSSGVTVDDNEVYDNRAPGIWFDIDNRDIVISNNRIHHNTEGIFYEISFGNTKIFGNRIWENGWPGYWGYGAGILVASSSGVEVFGNTVAWNARGISVVSQDRGGPDDVWNRVRDVYVHDNTVLVSTAGRGALGWYQDFTGVLFDPASNNRGARNQFWFAAPEPSSGRFEWNGTRRTLAAFELTPGEEGGRYLTLAEKTAGIGAAGVPPEPEPRS